MTVSTARPHNFLDVRAITPIAPMESVPIMHLAKAKVVRGGFFSNGDIIYECIDIMAMC